MIYSLLNNGPNSCSQQVCLATNNGNWKPLIILNGIVFLAENPLKEYKQANHKILNNFASQVSSLSLSLLNKERTTKFISKFSSIQISSIKLENMSSTAVTISHEYGDNVEEHQSQSRNDSVDNKTKTNKSFTVGHRLPKLTKQHFLPSRRKGMALHALWN